MSKRKFSNSTPSVKKQKGIGNPFVSTLETPGLSSLLLECVPFPECWRWREVCNTACKEIPQQTRHVEMNRHVLPHTFPRAKSLKLTSIQMQQLELDEKTFPKVRSVTMTNCRCTELKIPLVLKEFFEDECTFGHVQMTWDSLLRVQLNSPALLEQFFQQRLPKVQAFSTEFSDVVRYFGRFPLAIPNLVELTLSTDHQDDLILPNLPLETVRLELRCHSLTIPQPLALRRLEIDGSVEQVWCEEYYFPFLQHLSLVCNNGLENWRMPQLQTLNLEYMDVGEVLHLPPGIQHVYTEKVNWSAQHCLHLQSVHAEDSSRLCLNKVPSLTKLEILDCYLERQKSMFQEIPFQKLTTLTLTVSNNYFFSIQECLDILAQCNSLKTLRIRLEAPKNVKLQEVLRPIAYLALQKVPDFSFQIGNLVRSVQYWLSLLQTMTFQEALRIIKKR